jgi:hypothetical protein
MKYKFIVDENIFYCALKGVDEHDNKDFSSARFLAYLLKNCHTIYLDKEYNRRYENNIPNKLERISNNKNEHILPGIDLLIQDIFHTSEKIIREFSNSLKFPDEEKIPREDIYIARCANHFSAKIVTLDKDFREAVNAHGFLKQNGIEALHPKDAIKFVTET